jgi:hypothetical protein
MWQRRFRLDRYPIWQQIYQCGLTSEQLFGIYHPLLQDAQAASKQRTGARLLARGPLARFVLAVFAAVREHNPTLRPIKDSSIGRRFYEIQKSKGGED